MPEVLIAGGGIAGCAAALALHRAGVDVSVHEAHPTSTEDLGAFLIIPSSGVQVLDELKVLGPLERAATPLTGMKIVSSDGRTTLGSRAMAAADAYSYRLVRRGALCDVLQQQVEAAGIPLRRGSRVTKASGELGSLEVQDESGMKYRADLVVAADGLRSTLRGVVNPLDPPPRYVGQLVFWGFTPGQQWGTLADMHVIRAETGAFGYIPIEAGTYWFARVTAPERSRTEMAELDLSTFLRESLTGLPKEIAATARPFGTASYDLPYVSEWYASGVLLIGDAAHAASPATGQGGGYALEDALVLGKAVRDRDGLAEAVEVYEHARRDRTQANVVASARMSTGPDTLTDAPPGRSLDPAEVLTQVRWGDPLLV